MPNLNRVFLMGNLTRDVELRVTPKGTAIGQFGLAINRKWKDESGAEKEDVCFVDVEVWGKQAETLAKYVTKGKPLFVEGRLKFDQWEDKTDGKKRSKLKVILEQFQFIGGKDEQATSGAQAPESGGYAPPPARRASPAPAGNIDEDVPF